jgi:glycosyltransferase involved in cell wall biosynthesis
VSISDSDRSPELDYTATVYNGIDSKDFTLNEKPKDYLLFFGRIHPEKGTYESIQIAKKANMKLIISGLIQDEAYFNEKVKPYINDDDIVYVGNSGPKERDKLLGEALALLHPISFDEPFGLSVAEAMFCGTPVVAFNRGSMSELIDHSKTGYLVNNIDEAARAVNSINTIDRMHCRQRAMSNFSLEKMADGYLNVYKQILQI